MRLLLTRYDYQEKQTLGRLFILDNNNAIIAEWDTLELPWRDNQRRVSCIPTGSYKARKHRSPRFGHCLWLQEVPNRSEILIHRGNYHKDILGCILIGKDLSDINKDGYLDVIDSRTAMYELMDKMTPFDGVMIDIVDSN